MQYYYVVLSVCGVVSAARCGVASSISNEPHEDSSVYLIVYVSQMWHVVYAKSSRGPLRGDSFGVSRVASFLGSGLWARELGNFKPRLSVLTNQRGEKDSRNFLRFLESGECGVFEPELL